jgi:short-subunit dehydrogenase
MPRKIQGSVVVITGASSGIGRAAALAFARRGARLVLAARREAPLVELLAECEHLGATAVAVPTDMTDERAVQTLARRAVEAFGRVDTWINNHGVTLFARFEETPPDEFRRVLEVDFFGTVYGARAALPIFRRQGSGVLINTGSMLSRLSLPYMSAYVAAKHAVRGLGMSLRQELVLERAKDIHVCTVMPAAIDTPLFQHAANHTGRKAKAMPPVYSPERVAKTYLRLAERPRGETFVGNAARMLFFQNLLAPKQTEAQLAVMADRLHLYPERGQAPTRGNLFAPVAEGDSVRGGWQAPVDPIARRAGAIALAAIPAALLGRWLLGRRAPALPEPGTTAAYGEARDGRGRAE